LSDNTFSQNEFSSFVTGANYLRTGSTSDSVTFGLFYTFSALFQRATRLTVLNWAQEKFLKAFQALSAWGRGEKLQNTA
jgi:hypothetical protein